MHIVLCILSAGFIVSSLLSNKAIGLSSDNESPKPEEDAEDYIEDVDFDGFEDEPKGLLVPSTSGSLMHVHHEDGEVLVPCFGMWWPMGGYGGGGGGYEYIDYYGDYRKKRRRSRKQKKAAKMKKKKS